MWTQTWPLSELERTALLIKEHWWKGRDCGQWNRNTSICERTGPGTEVILSTARTCTKVGGEAQDDKFIREVEDQKWEGKLFASRWKDDELDKGCFNWMHDWRTAGVQELYQQLLPMKLYLGKKGKTHNIQDYTCRMCGKCQESVAHVVAGCSTIAQTKYLDRHNNVLRIMFLKILSKYNLTPREEYAW